MQSLAMSMARATRGGTRPRRAAVVVLVVAFVSGLSNAGVAASERITHLGDVGVAHERAANSPQTLREMRWWFRTLRLGRAHRQTTGAGATVAVIDDSLDPSIPELRGQNVHMRRSCRGERSRPITGRPAASHGTSMVTLIVGSGRGNALGGKGIRGVAPDARLLFYAADRNPMDEKFVCSGERISRLMNAAVRDGADIISASFGGALDDDVRRAVDHALTAGVVIVAAAGDLRRISSYSFFPAGHPGVVSVDAINERHRLWSQSPPNINAVVAAPGVHIGSGFMTESGQWYSAGWVTGTSPATAITAGTLALVKSRYPKATGYQLIQHLVHTAGGKRYTWRHGYGFGVVDPLAMLASSPEQWPNENPLWLHPREALTNYPMWASSAIDDPRENRPNTQSGKSSPAPDRAASATSSLGKPAESTATRSTVSIGTWVVVLLLLFLVIVAVIVGLTRRRSAR
jgi:subtilisin family serine protease